jgi:inosine-uridine nucleoside N-ribohydrolase
MIGRLNEAGVAEENRLAVLTWQVLCNLCGKAFDRKVREGRCEDRKERRTASFFLTLLAVITAGAVMTSSPMAAQSSGASAGRKKIIIDTDIGDDIDDAFAVALALRSPELQVLGITTAFGDTEARAKILDRMLGEVGRQDIPVAVGAPTKTKNFMSQRRYGESGRFTRASQPDAVDFILDQIRRYPGEITLVGIGPLVNVGGLIDRDPQTFRKLKRVVIMGGSIDRGYGDPYAGPTPPQPEWNIINDIPAAQKLFASGVPLYVMPLDSTQLKLDEVKRKFLFRQGTPLTDSLTLLYHLWGQQTPTLFDPMTIAFIDDPKLCPVQAMNVVVDDKGMTRRGTGTPNAEVCLKSDPEEFFRFYLGRVAGAEGSVK